MLKYPIHSAQDLRNARYILHVLETQAHRTGQDIEADLIPLKGEIRRFEHFGHGENVRPLNIIKEYDDGYISLEKMPDYRDSDTEEEISSYFEEHCSYAFRPSMYDCTGRPFTSWFKPMFRQGHWYIYHRVCYDV